METQKDKRLQDHRAFLSSLTWYQTESKQKLFLGEAMPVFQVKMHRPTQMRFAEK